MMTADEGGGTHEVGRGPAPAGGPKPPFEQLRARIAGSARYQEGEDAPEDARELISTCHEVLDELETLIRQINRTNSATQTADGRTLSDALAERDVLRLRYSLYSGAADAASGVGQRGMMLRSTRSELKVIRRELEAFDEGLRRVVAAALRRVFVDTSRRTAGWLRAGDDAMASVTAEELEALAAPVLDAIA